MPQGSRLEMWLRVVRPGEAVMGLAVVGFRTCRRQVRKYEEEYVEGSAGSAKTATRTGWEFTFSTHRNVYSHTALLKPTPS